MLQFTQKLTEKLPGLLVQAQNNFPAPSVPIVQPTAPTTIPDFLRPFYDYFNSYAWARLHFTLELFGAFCSIALLIALVVIEIKHKFFYISWKAKLRNMLDPINLPKDEIQKKRDLIKENLLRGEQKSLRQAVIIADEILHQVLYMMGYGDKVAEQLKLVPHEILPNFMEVERVHLIVEGFRANPGFILDKKQIDEIIKIYNEAFKNLGLDETQPIK